jgi:hypothetical protein
MPEATVHKDCFLTSEKNKVGPPRQVSPVKPKAVAKAMNEASDTDFRFHSLTFDPLHVRRSLSRRYSIHTPTQFATGPPRNRFSFRNIGSSVRLTPSDCPRLVSASTRSQKPYFSLRSLKAASPPSMMRLIASRTSGTSIAPSPAILPPDWSPAFRWSHHATSSASPFTTRFAL